MLVSNRFTRTMRTMAGLGIVSGALFSTAAFAGTGMPTPWEINLQGAATEVQHSIHNFHTLLMWIITPITIFVAGLLVYVCLRFNERSNPTPSKITHNTLLEVAWTVLPILILVVIAIPSFRLLKLQLDVPKGDITIKATGKQWYWSFEYPKDQGGFGFDSIMISEDDWKKNIAPDPAKAAEAPRLLAVDNEVVVPVNKTVVLQVTGGDVIHNFALPSFGVKIDAIPGRLNQTWFKVEREGIYYGQCSRLCGQNHAFMPIAIRVVSEEKYAAWLEEAKKKYASIESAPATSVAAAETAR